MQMSSYADVDGVCRRTIRCHAGYVCMNRLGYLVVFIAVTGLVFGALVGFDKLIGGAG